MRPGEPLGDRAILVRRGGGGVEEHRAHRRPRLRLAPCLEHGVEWSDDGLQLGAIRRGHGAVAARPGDGRPVRPVPEDRDAALDRRRPPRDGLGEAGERRFTREQGGLRAPFGTTASTSVTSAAAAATASRGGRRRRGTARATAASPAPPASHAQAAALPRSHSAAARAASPPAITT